MVGPLQILLANKADASGRRDHVDFHEPAALGCEREKFLRPSARNVVIHIAGLASGKGDPWLHPPSLQGLAVSELHHSARRHVQLHSRPAQPDSAQIIAAPHSLGRQTAIFQAAEKHAGGRVIHLVSKLLHQRPLRLRAQTVGNRLKFAETQRLKRPQLDLCLDPAPPRRSRQTRGFAMSKDACECRPIRSSPVRD